MSTSHIAHLIKKEIHILEADLYAMEGETITSKEDLVDLRRAYKALVGVECSPAEPED